MYRWLSATLVDFYVIVVTLSVILNTEFFKMQFHFLIPVSIWDATKYKSGCIQSELLDDQHKHLCNLLLE